VEIVTLRGSAIGRMPRGETVRSARGAGRGAMTKRRVFVTGAWREVKICRAGDLVTEIRGPAIIEDDYTTIFVTEDWRCAPGARDTLVATRDEAKGGTA
jgi:N-methylhydantoinase A